MGKKSFLFRRKTADRPPPPPQQSSTTSSTLTGASIQSEDGDGAGAGGPRLTVATALTSGTMSVTAANNRSNTTAVAAAVSASSRKHHGHPTASSGGEFLVTIPPDVEPGENFQVKAGGKIFRVRCPLNSNPGQQVKIALPVVVEKNKQQPLLQQKHAGNETGGVGCSGKQIPSSSFAEVTSSSQPSDNIVNGPQQQEDDPNNDKKETKMFEVIVPRGVKPGCPFALVAGGVRVLVSCPANATMGNKIRFRLPIDLLHQPDGPKSHLAAIILSYDKNGWTRTIRATTDMKFIWTRLDEIGNVDQRTRFDTERSAYVRKIHYVREKDGSVNEKMIRGRCTLVTPDRVAVDSKVKNSNGDDIITFRDIVSAQMMSYDDKVEWFHTTCKQLATERGLVLPVRRACLLEDSINLIMSLNPMALRKPWVIKFEGEPGLDAGGLMREWFELVTEELFNPLRGLWKDNSNNQLEINPFSGECLSICSLY